MVSKLITGKRIKGALNYNETKVAEGKATLLFAGNYLKNANELSFNNKLNRLVNLAARNDRTKTNCIHVSLNFSPSEKLSNDKMIAIANAYMSKIGFGEQPYLVYRHEDSGHPHIHIVSTNIQANGKRIALHNIGKNQSEGARKEIEKEFNLIPAEGKTHNLNEIQPGKLKKPIYGKVETKAAISHIVRGVVDEYKYTSFSELNAILEGLNTTAYRGEVGSKMYANRGLTFSILDSYGNKKGVPIKASSIYTKPTLSRIEGKFEQNRISRSEFKDALKKAIDVVSSSYSITDKESFKETLANKGISVVYHKNDSMVYGITFVDHNSKVAYKGSELGKDYTAKRILERLGIGRLSDEKARQDNQKLVKKVLNETDYSNGAPSAIADWYAKGLKIEPIDSPVASTEYYIGTAKSPPYLYQKLDRKYRIWIGVNGLSPSIFRSLNTKQESVSLLQLNVVFPKIEFLNILKGILVEMPEYTAPSINPDLKKKKRKKNW